MDSEKKNIGKLNAADLLSAMKQNKLTTEQFAADIRLILDDYFVGVSERRGNSVVFTLLNGQQFRITVDKERRKLFGKRKI